MKFDVDPSIIQLLRDHEVSYASDTGPSHRKVQLEEQNPTEKITDVRLISSNPLRHKLCVQPNPFIMHWHPAPQQWLPPSWQPPNQMSVPKKGRQVNFGRQEHKQRKFDPLPMALSQLLPQLLARNLLTLVPYRPIPDPPPRSFNPNARCEYHSGQTGHWTNRCTSLRHRVQDLLDKDLIEFHLLESRPNMFQNSLSPHYAPRRAKQAF